jgi:hypothetical protein
MQGQALQLAYICQEALMLVAEASPVIPPCHEAERNAADKSLSEMLPAFTDVG